MELFEYDFMRRAFLVGILLAVMIPCIGVIMVLKRLSMIGDALAHSSLAGVAAGLLMGINPIIGSVIACLVSALGIEGIRRKIPRYAELSIAVVLSAGVGVAGLLSGMLKGAAEFNSFLFGSIVAISDLEMVLVLVVSAVAIAVFLAHYRALFAVAFDERGARLVGISVGRLNFVFTMLTAIVVSIAARTVGALMVSSLMVIPVICAMQVARSYFQTVVWSIVFGILFTVSGLSIAYYEGLRSGSTIVLVGVAVLLMLLLFRQIYARYRKNISIF